MIYLVSKNKSLFESNLYKESSFLEALSILLPLKQVQFDTETTGKDPHICSLLTAQFGNKKANVQIVVDATTVDFRIYKEVFETKLIIGHNLKFDCQFCYKYKIISSFYKFNYFVPKYR